ncbi:MAG: diguanylate cyclase [Fibromonadales bacterium]|nr:diguanylate cyclase [Fibromonadales bacterium]
MIRFFAVISLLILSCEKSTERYVGESPKYSSYLDVPGISQEEIQAIEALKEEQATFVYGMIMTNETFYDEDGEIKGFSALFCKWLTEFFGIEFKPAIYSWDELVTGLENGEIDFSGELTATEERRKTYFMTDAIAERTIKYMRLAGSMPIPMISVYRPLRYAFLEGSTTVTDVSATLKGENFEVILVNNSEEAYDLLKSGGIDAFYGEGIEAFFDVYTDVVSYDAFPVIYGPVSLTTQKQKLVPIISVMQKTLENDGIRYLIELYNKGQRDYKKHKFFKHILNEEERIFILANPVISYAAEVDNYPISFYNKHDKQWQGVFFDVLTGIESLTGINFELGTNLGTNWSEMLEMLKAGEVSLVSDLVQTKERQGNFLWPKNSILQSKHALISKTSFHDANINEILRMKIGLFKGTVHADLFNTWFPNHPNAIEYETVTAAFAALERNEVDMVMASQYLLLFLTNYMEFTGYKINIVFDHYFESSLGFNKDEVILCSIIDKAIGQIDIPKISGKWMRKTFDYRAKIAQSRLPWLVGVSVLLLIIIILLLILHHRTLTEERRLEVLIEERTAELVEQRKMLERLSLTDQLTNIANRRNFDAHLYSEWRRATREKLSISLLMLDVDKFKNYNDTYGHQKGDEILKNVAQCLLHAIKRPCDLAARWGGEEFAVLLPNTPLNGAIEIAEAMRANVERTTDVTVSIGVATEMPMPSHDASIDSAIDHFISAADDALYKAKAAGRNKVVTSSI